MGLAYMSGCLGCGSFWRMPLRELGAAEVLREVVHLDHVLAQRFLALPEGKFLGRDDLVLKRQGAQVDTRLNDDLPLLHRLAQLLVHRLAGEGGKEGSLEDRGRIG